MEGCRLGAENTGFDGFYQPRAPPARETRRNIDLRIGDYSYSETDGMQII